jgi:hypothetical protein
MRVFAYDFSRHQVPGMKPYEDATYGRDTATTSALAQAPRRDPFCGSQARGHRSRAAATSFSMN